MTFLQRSWKNVVNFHSHTRIFVLTGTNFTVGYAWTKLISLWDETFKWFAEIVKILKTVSYEPAYHWIKGWNIWRKDYTAMLKFFFYWKMTNNFEPVSHSVRLFCLFSMHNVRDWSEQWLKKILSCHLWEAIEIDVLFYGHHWGEPCLTQISILKRYHDFKCMHQQLWKLFTQSTPKFRKVTAARY